MATEEQLRVLIKTVADTSGAQQSMARQNAESGLMALRQDLGGKQDALERYRQQQQAKREELRSSGWFVQAREQARKLLGEHA